MREVWPKHATDQQQILPNQQMNITIRTSTRMLEKLRSSRKSKSQEHAAITHHYSVTSDHNTFTTRIPQLQQQPPPQCCRFAGVKNPRERLKKSTEIHRSR